ncbi:glycosyltransferase family 4 protein [Oxynema aestuarii]|uniref:Glycosyltransferase n=1 Tax=Oxynema aestuarii AP17 TaxID=2064643 RepID=A0A6H1TY99_9CYAN|nr:glycosyltransferase family 4 protein [Oxynema aestuarii]QIZ71561.1 glycosyltransferase [Oxynema aestuarii AP17]RMH74474.1 MAG: glycosyltransferase [Cyanobacteria bacterium J007]
MNVLSIGTDDSESGAGRAAYQLHRGLREGGIHSQMLVQNKRTDDPDVLLQGAKFWRKLAQFSPNLTALPVGWYRDRTGEIFSPQWFPGRIAAQVRGLDPDLINLHWLGWGFVRLETLPQFQKPLVWTFHDMWAFTGGCHYTGECDRYKQRCGDCPQLNSHREQDLSRWVWKRKAKAWKNLDLTVVTPSRWLARCASESSLLGDRRVEVIPNGLDLETYKPFDRTIARQLLKLPSDKLLVLFGAVSATSDRRKGFHLLQSALKHLSELGWRDRLELVVFGASEPIDPPDLGFRCHYLGRLRDELSISLVYAAADLFAAPSIQDNLPNTIMEALSCGTPCIGFEIGGIGEMIEHQGNGYLATPFETENFARGIAWILEDPERWQKLRDRAREKAQAEFSRDLQARRYLDLFDELLDRQSERCSKGAASRTTQAPPLQQ